jgi:adenylate cyclase
MLLLGGGVAAAVIARQIKRRIGRMLRSMAERTALIQLFGQQVSEPVANELLRHPDHARGVTRELTVMFVDIRDFTPFAERHSAEEVVEYLNRLFDRMIAVIDRHGGIINQFLGDGFMTTFGAPVPMEDHARRAILAAVELDDIVARMSRDGEIPPTRIGIGLHSGEAVTGNIGAASRRQYSITGAAVIIASRIEQLNKEYASSVLASAETWRTMIIGMPSSRSARCV